MRPPRFTPPLALAVCVVGLVWLAAARAAQDAVPSAPRPSIGAQRSGHTTTVLADGRVLLAGGRVEVGGVQVWMRTAAVFDPSTGSLTPAGEMVGVREDHNAIRLKDGRVLITGGRGPAGPDGRAVEALATAEIYDPSAGRFTVTGSMTRARASQTAELLANGQVLIEGGEVPASPASTAEMFDPRTGRFTLTRVRRH